MHERKSTMFDRADAFVALPGGIGTLEELIEQMTWAQLGRHKKPILIANINGFWNPLLSLLAHMRMAGLVPPPSRGVDLLVVEHVADILPKLQEAVRGVSEAREANGSAGRAVVSVFPARPHAGRDARFFSCSLSPSISCTDRESGLRLALVPAPGNDGYASRTNVTASMRLPSGSRTKAA